MAKSSFELWSMQISHPILVNNKNASLHLAHWLAEPFVLCSNRPKVLFQRAWLISSKDRVWSLHSDQELSTILRRNCQHHLWRRTVWKFVACMRKKREESMTGLEPVTSQIPLATWSATTVYHHQQLLSSLFISLEAPEFGPNSL